MLFERYYISTLAHAYAVGCLKGIWSSYEIALNWYEENINKRIKMPDAYIFIDVPIDIAVSRIKQRGRVSLDTFWENQMYLECCEKYKQQFLEQYESQVKKFHIDGTRPISLVVENINSIIEDLNRPN